MDRRREKAAIEEARRKRREAKRAKVKPQVEGARRTREVVQAPTLLAPEMFRFDPSPVNGPRIKFPDRDLEEIHNYTEGMWDMVLSEGEPRVVVEVGSRRGVWASGLMKRTKNTRLFCIDIWSGRQGQGDLRAWFARCKEWAFSRAFPLHGSSGYWSECFPYAYDAVFVDAGHGYQEAFDDFTWWSDRLSPGGLLLGHDYNQEPVRKAAHDVFGEGNVESGFFGMGKAETFWLRKE